MGNLKDSLKQMERSLKEEQMLKNLYRKDLDDARSSNRSLVQAKVCRLAVSLYPDLRLPLSFSISRNVTPLPWLSWTATACW